jgi:hypothetical protein
MAPVCTSALFELLEVLTAPSGIEAIVFQKFPAIFGFFEGC